LSAIVTLGIWSAMCAPQQGPAIRRRGLWARLAILIADPKCGADEAACAIVDGGDDDKARRGGFGSSCWGTFMAREEAIWHVIIHDKEQGPLTKGRSRRIPSRETLAMRPRNRRGPGQRWPRCRRYIPPGDCRDRTRKPSPMDLREAECRSGSRSCRRARHRNRRASIRREHRESDGG
jgi:hypothetical protein